MTRPAVRPLNLSEIGTVGALAALLTTVTTWNVYGWVAPMWVVTSRQLREGSYLGGVLMAAVAAWVASTASPRSIVASPSHARAGRDLVLHQLGGLIGAAWSGTLLALAPVLVVTARRATAGAADWLTIADGFLVVALWICLGYVVGCWLPGRWGVPAAGLLAYAVFAAPQLSLRIPLYAIAPVWSLDWPYLGDVTNPLLMRFRIVFFATLIASLALVASLLTARGSDRRVRGGVLAATVLLPVAVLGILAVTTRPVLVLPEADAPIECRESAQSRVCVHAGLRQLLDPAAEATTRVIAGRSWSGDEPLTVVETSASAAVSPPDLVVRADLTSVEAFENAWAMETAYALSGLAACSSDRSEVSLSDGWLGAETIARELTTRAGYAFVSRVATGSGVPIDTGTELAAQLAPMTDAEFTAWLIENDDAVAQCRIATGT